MFHKQAEINLVEFLELAWFPAAFIPFQKLIINKISQLPLFQVAASLNILLELINLKRCLPIHHT